MMVNKKLKVALLLLRPVIGALLRGEIRPLIGYLKFLRYTKSEQLEKYSEGSIYFVVYRAFHILNKVIYKRLIEGFPLIMFNEENIKFAIYSLSDIVYLSPLYEKQTKKILLKKLKENLIFIDVGANVGFYSVTLAKLCNCKVYAFEPLPRNINILRINARLNKVHIYIYDFAVGDRSDKVKLFGNISSPGNFSLTRNAENYAEIEMKTLDEVLGNLDKIDVIKIDVEGAENLVLRGAQKVLDKTEAVIIEINNESFYESHKILLSKGFKLIRILDGINALYEK